MCRVVLSCEEPVKTKNNQDEGSHDETERTYSLHSHDIDDETTTLEFDTQHPTDAIMSCFPNGVEQRKLALKGKNDRKRFEKEEEKKAKEDRKQKEEKKRQKEVGEEEKRRKEEEEKEEKEDEEKGKKYHEKKFARKRKRGEGKGKEAALINERH